MGASSGGVAIKTNTINVDLTKVVKDLFGSDFEKNNDYCDTRQNSCVYIGKTKDFLIIVNTDFAASFFKSQRTDSIQKYLDYFSNPHFVFAFEEYDSGGTYSYSLIYNGIIKRQFRSVTYEIKADFGALEPVELKWKNAEITKEDVGDGEFEILYKDPASDFKCTGLQLPLVILRELMLEKLGFITWNMNDFMIEQTYFRKAL